MTVCSAVCRVQCRVSKCDRVEMHPWLSASPPPDGPHRRRAFVPGTLSDTPANFLFALDVLFHIIEWQLVFLAIGRLNALGRLPG